LFAYVNSKAPSVPTGSTATLVNIDKITGDATEVNSGGTSLPNAWIAGAAFDMNNKLWVINYLDMSLIQINHTDGSVVESRALKNVPLLPSNAIEAIDIAFDADNNAYITVSDSVYSLNVATGEIGLSALYTVPSSMIVGATPNMPPMLGGMAFYRDGEVWFTQGRNTDRIIYGDNINTLNSSAHNAMENLNATLIAAIGEFVGNSGVMDLAARPTRKQTAVPANNPIALISLALGMVGAGAVMLRRRRKQLQ
jgi:hypothetical protein